ncbi:esterase [Arenicella chitinivorans]|uniref:Esterase n=1 Tax=Arenicella chitinivorans TaxID=1329800 RepID=A0A918RSN9_9GAMM|nr:alpha/beta fold hydrolase [Arenicella chitinivorans]GHA08708.1 esterase [Arenicella chitinivorans]
MNLHYEAYPEALSAFDSTTPPVVILPGLFGSTTNWRGFAKKLARSAPVVVLDQRNHGRSPHANTHSYQDMVDDLLAFLDHHNLNQIILCGHSMGGKVAMLFAHQHPDRLSKLAVLDIAPVIYRHSHVDFVRAMLEIDLARLNSRSDADRQLSSAIKDTATRLFLLQSLVGSPGDYEWRLNLPVLLEYMPQIVGFPESALDHSVVSVPALFLYGENSNYVKAQHHDLIRQHFSQAEFESVPNAGHWLHAEQPKRVLQALLGFIQRD